MTSNQGLTPMTRSPFTLYKQSLHLWPHRFSPIAYGANPVLPNHSPCIIKWLRRYRQTNASCCFRYWEIWSLGEREGGSSQTPNLNISTSPRDSPAPQASGWVSARCTCDEMHLRRSRQVTRGHRPSPVGGASGCVVRSPDE